MVRKNRRAWSPFLIFMSLLLCSMSAAAETVVVYNSPQPGPVNVLQGIVIEDVVDGVIKSSESYVAKGDCATDDSAAINQMINVLEHSPPGHSGEVYFPRPPGGCYLVSNSLILNGDPTWTYNYIITLKGDGAGVSIVKAGAIIDAVLLKNRNFNMGGTIENITFDANALAKHAIHIESGDGTRISHIEGLNGTTDDLRLDCYGGTKKNPCTDGGLLVSDSTFANFTIFPDYNIVLTGEDGRSKDWGSTDNELINNTVENARIANIYEDITGTNHFTGNHAVTWPLSMCPEFGFVTEATSVWLNNQTDCSTEAGFFVKGGGLIENNIVQGAQNHGFCLSNTGVNGGGGAIITGNTMSFINAEGTSISPPAGNAIVQSDVNGCAGTGTQTATWGNKTNNNSTGNVVQNNTPTSNENIWNMLYVANPSSTIGAATPSMIGIGTSQPKATLDVNGFARLSENASAPAVCSATNKGAITLNATGRLCVCNGLAWKMNSTNQQCWN